MFASKTVSKILFFTLLFSVFSCVKDVDLDQYEEITVPPTAALDLVYFTLEPSNFNSGASQPARVTDEVRLEFLDDDYIQNGLVKADFNFRLTNTFSRAFTVSFNFLSENGSLNYVVVVEVPAGMAGQPAIVDYTEIVEGSNIVKIKNSINILVEVEIHSTNLPTEGELQLESKAYYTFDF